MLTSLDDQSSLIESNYYETKGQSEGIWKREAHSSFCTGNGTMGINLGISVVTNALDSN